MSKVTLNPLTSGWNATTLNTNLQKIEDALNNEVLYRNNPLGEPNSMSNNLDMNGKRIYNIPAPVSPSEPARLQDIIDSTTGGSANIIAFSPTGSVSSTNVQGAIEEVVSDLDALTPTTGAGKVGYNSTLTYPANTIGAALKANEIGTSVTTGKILANTTTDTGTPDAAIKVARVLSTGITDGHGFREQTVFSRTTESYAAFDSAISSEGSGTNDHIAGFQSRPTINRSGGSLTHVYNFVSSPTFSSGTAINNYGLFCYNPVGAGTVNYNYGIYIPLQTKGSIANYPIYVTQQGSPSFFGSPLQVNNLFTVNPSVPLMIGAPTSLDYPFVGYNYNPQTDNKAISDVAVTCKFDTSGFRIYTKASGAPTGTGTLATMTEGLRVNTLGDVIKNVNTTSPSLTVNQQMVFALTSNTNLRISVRGTDGVTRVANLTLA